MDFQTELVLNLLAQGIRSPSEGDEWFAKHTREEQLAILRQLSYFALQGGAYGQDVSMAIARAGLRRTFTPCVLLSKGPLRIQIAKVLALPQDEYQKSFQLLVALFSVADERRREKCAGKCTHWWHQDLTDPMLVERISRGTKKQ